ncbi:hypothetical protein ABA10_02775 [Bacillus subtilis]|nr:hypothetical protein ABA10_02775 [Bacillus subtilis]
MKMRIGEINLNNSQNKGVRKPYQDVLVWFSKIDSHLLKSIFMAIPFSFPSFITFFMSFW